MSASITVNPCYLTIDQPGIGGRIKVRPEDFFVEEIPLYSPVGEGQHVYATIEKIGLSTPAAVRKIARALGISPRIIGYAGLKDAQAITRQTISIDKVPPEAIEQLNFPNIKILDVARHRNKLKMGHLAGNRFRIRVRDVSKENIKGTEAILAALVSKGVPNFFDSQRFGNRGNTDRLGELLIHSDSVEFVAEFLGRPQAHEAPSIQTARQLVDEGKWTEALSYWPDKFSDERRMVAAIARADGNIESATKVLNKKLKIFFISAFQSQMFNSLLADRLNTIDQLENGDIAYIHQKGASFLVEDADSEQPRAERFEISPSGPMFGLKTKLAEGAPGARERKVLASYGLSLEDFQLADLKIRGTRRPYRFQLKTPEVWWDDGLMVSFELPSGSYATRVMAEIMKS